MPIRRTQILCLLIALSLWGLGGTGCMGGAGGFAPQGLFNAASGNDPSINSDHSGPSKDDGNTGDDLGGNPPPAGTLPLTPPSDSSGDGGGDGGGIGDQAKMNIPQLPNPGMGQGLNPTPQADPSPSNDDSSVNTIGYIDRSGPTQFADAPLDRLVVAPSQINLH